MNDNSTGDDTQDIQDTDQPEHDAVPVESPDGSALPHPIDESTPDILENGDEPPEMIQVIQGETYIYERLTRRQIEALPFLIKPGTITQRAKNAGIGRATLYRWLQESDFREAFEELRKETLRFAETEAQAIAGDAISVIYELMHTGDQGVRLRAALAALNLAKDARFAEEIANRLEHLERASEIRKKANWPGM